MISFLNFVFLESINTDLNIERAEEIFVKLRGNYLWEEAKEEEEEEEKEDGCLH